MKRSYSFASFASITAALLSLAILVSPRTARADIGVDVQGTYPQVAPGKNGWGVGLRFGQELHAPLIAFTPEVQMAYASFGPPIQVFTGMGGIRLGLGELVRPGAFGHVGWGYAVPQVGQSRLGVAFDVGAFFDFTLIPLVNVGVHAGYNYLGASDPTNQAFKWITLGAHIDCVF